MRKSGIIFSLLILVGAGLYVFTTRYEIKLGSLHWAFSQEKHVLSQLAESFLEDLQFKDFEKAATYHSQEDQGRVDIPSLMERLFKIKPEFLDIMKYEITDIDIDKSGTRARVKTHTTVKLLNTQEIREPDVILYWKKDDDGWHMKLESSLQ